MPLQLLRHAMDTLCSYRRFALCKPGSPRKRARNSLYSNAVCRRIACWTVIAWTILTLIIVGLLRITRFSFHFLLVEERVAAAVTACILLAFKLTIRWRQSVTNSFGTRADHFSWLICMRTGSQLLVDVVLWLTVASEVIMAASKTLVLGDPVTRCRSPVMRWVEGAAVFVPVTFMAEIVDDGHEESTIFLVATQATSMLCTMLLPFALGPYTWWMLTAVSLLTYATIFAPLPVKRSRAMRANARIINTQYFEGELLSSLRQVRIQTAAKRAVAAYKFFLACVIRSLYTVRQLVLRALSPESQVNFLDCVTKIKRGDGRRRHAWPFLVQSAWNVVTIFFVATLHDVVNAEFANESQVEREVAIVRTFLGGLWVSKHDAIGISFLDRTSKKCMSLFSPNLVHVIGGYCVISACSATGEVPPREDESLTNLARFLRDVLCSCAAASVDGIGDNTRLDNDTISVEFNLGDHNLEDTATAVSSIDVPTSPCHEIYVPGAIRQLARQVKLTDLIAKSWAVGLARMRGTVEHRIFNAGTVATNEGSEGSADDPSCGECPLEATRSIDVLVRLLAGEPVVVMVLRSDSIRMACEILIQRDSAGNSLKVEDLCPPHELKKLVLDTLQFTDSQSSEMEDIALGIELSDCEDADDESSCRFYNVRPGCESYHTDSLSPGVSSNSIAHFKIDVDTVQLDDASSRATGSDRWEPFARMLVDGSYAPREDVVDLSELLQIHRSGESAGRFVLQLPNDAMPLPPLVVDEMLLRLFHGSACLNALKLGRADGQVTTYVGFDAVDGTLTVQVVYLPGKELQDVQIQDGADVPLLAAEMISSWIATECARLLRGQWSHNFVHHRIVNQLTCPTHVARRTNFQPSIDKTTGWTVPRDNGVVWGIALDKCATQRCIVTKMFDYIGICRQHIVVSGGTREEIDSFGDATVEHVRSHPEDRCIILANEDIDEYSYAAPSQDAESVVSTSGSYLLQYVIAALGPELAGNVLAIVRLNADSHGADIIGQRAHGYMFLEATSRDAVCHIFQTLWEARFSKAEKGARTPRIPCISKDFTNSATLVASAGLQQGTDGGSSASNSFLSC